MKNKMLVVLGVSFGLAIVISYFKFEDEIVISYFKFEDVFLNAR